jgi:hypothetical protein
MSHRPRGEQIVPGNSTVEESLNYQRQYDDKRIGLFGFSRGLPTLPSAHVENVSQIEPCLPRRSKTRFASSFTSSSMSRTTRSWISRGPSSEVRALLVHVANPIRSVEATKGFFRKVFRRPRKDRLISGQGDARCVSGLTTPAHTSCMDN